MSNELDFAKANSIFKYNPDTGIITYKISRGCKAAGFEAGYLHRTGYIQIEVNGKAYLAHRLAWLLYWGSWPKENIDHINRVKTDNRICNLRDCSQKVNTSNRGLNKNNTSGYTGVSYNSSRSNWVAKYGTKTIGYFSTPEEAALARDTYLKTQLYENIIYCRYSH